MDQSYKDDIETAKTRVEAWWQKEIVDRGVVHAAAPRTHRRTLQSQRMDTAAWGQEQYRDYFTNPEVVIPRLVRELRGTYFGGESFPVVFPVSINMVAITAAYLGCPMRFVSTDTTWHDPVIEDWNNAPTFAFKADNPWWLASRRLLESAVKRSDGYFVGCPDLNGPTEVLSLMRGDERLALDLYDNPDRIKPALTKISDAWHAYWLECTAITQSIGGYFYWMGLWSERSSIDLQADFSCMISSSQFDEYFLPYLEEQTRLVDRTIYHLDGPGAIRHLDSLLSLPRLTGIQWIQGAGGGSVLQYLPLLVKIQKAGKLVSAFCEKREIERLYGALAPEGLFPIVTDCSSPEESGAVIRLVEGLSTRRRS